MRTFRIISNKMQCKECKDIIESKSIHDMVYCSCKKIAVDGGNLYLRRSGEAKHMIELSDVEVDGVRMTMAEYQEIDD